jgi:hypothetical protein
MGCLQRQVDAPDEALAPAILSGDAQTGDAQTGDDPSADDPPLEPAAGEFGRIEVSPAAIDFGGVTPGTLKGQWVDIDNGGPGLLTVHEVDIVGDEAGAFSLEVGSPRMVRVVAGYAPLRIQVGFRPPAAGRVRAWLRIRSDDPRRPDVRVELLGDGAGRCLVATPDQLMFPELSPGQQAEIGVTLRSCGRSSSTVRSVGFAPGTSYAFSFAAGRPVMTTLQPGKELVVKVIYEPSLPGIDAGRLEVQTDGVPSGVMFIDLIAQARPDDRPTAPPACMVEIQARDGSWRVVDDGAAAVQRQPMSEIQLRATGSQSEATEPPGYSWRLVDSPDDSLTRVEPDVRGGSVFAHLDLLGDYIFEVRVFDAAGQEDVCRIAVETVTDDDIHVEVIWDTPLDPIVDDQGRDAGTDLDLHVRRSDSDGWFCAPGDAYAGNPGPDWGVDGRSDDDPFIFADADGWGPEVFRLKTAEEGIDYRIAVHYVHDAGYGASIPSVKVYIQGQLRMHVPDRRLESQGLFWDVAAVHWPSQAIVVTDQLLDGAQSRGCDEFKRASRGSD